MPCRGSALGVLLLGGLLPGGLLWGVPAPGEVCPRGCLLLRGVYLVEDILLRTTTAAGSTHPTGMHSCSTMFFISL